MKLYSKKLLYFQETNQEIEKEEVDIEEEERLITEGFTRLLKKHPQSNTIIETILSYLNSIDLDDPDLGIYIRQCFEVISHERHKSIDDILESPNKMITPKEINSPVIEEVEHYLNQELTSLTPKVSNKKQTFTQSLLLSLFSKVTAILNSNNKDGYFDQQVYNIRFIKK